MLSIGEELIKFGHDVDISTHQRYGKIIDSSKVNRIDYHSKLSDDLINKHLEEILQETSNGTRHKRQRALKAVDGETRAPHCMKILPSYDLAIINEYDIYGMWSAAQLSTPWIRFGIDPFDFSESNTSKAIIKFSTKFLKNKAPHLFERGSSELLNISIGFYKTQKSESILKTGGWESSQYLHSDSHAKIDEGVLLCINQYFWFVTKEYRTKLFNSIDALEMPVNVIGAYNDEIPSEFNVIEGNSLAALLPDTKLFIGSGGYNTVLSCMSQSTPFINFPLVDDQFYWSKQVANHNISPQPIPFSAVEPKTMIELYDEAKNKILNAPDFLDSTVATNGLDSVVHSITELLVND